MNDITQIRSKVRDAYSTAAGHPGEPHAFPVGRTFAEALGYPADLLAEFPAAAVEAFSGVSNISISADIPAGSTILDVGCGAGLDALIAGRRAGPAGRVIGIDFSEAMLGRARASAAEARMHHVHFLHADAESLPLPDEFFDVALVNGIFNLNPARSAIFREIGRVVRRGGTVYAAELILSEPLPPEQRTESNWFA